ncbi:unnamed protein product [Plutella xylostella]|uniref:(diamondback moth) hypothetical protein n=1 Tax=Plutella xylostella TaxID=51655 RepID=A0A8S4DFF3_PLUXY|nr:unnamed protein product [Plutella xylostella]
MDLLSEATSGGGRVLAARHITADQAVPEVNNAVNTSLVCHSMDFMPDFKSYMTALHMYGPVLWTLAGAASLCTLLVYGLSLRAAYRRRSTFAHAAVILAVYPVGLLHFAALHMYGPVLWTLAGAASLCTLLVYGLSLRAAYRRRSTFAHAAVILHAEKYLAT